MTSLDDLMPVVRKTSQLDPVRIIHAAYSATNNHIQATKKMVKIVRIGCDEVLPCDSDDSRQDISCTPQLQSLNGSTFNVSPSTL
jgi:hypothetical protein